MNNMPSDLASLALARNSQRCRISSYDRTGGNSDRIHIKQGETSTIADLSGAGYITHIWMTYGNQGVPNEQEEYNLRKIVLRCYWDGEETPSVEAPLGDFFGMGHGLSKNYVSEPLQMSPENGRGLNCWFPMPFSSGAKMTITNECNSMLMLYYYVDYELHEAIPQDMLRFHARWHREMPTGGISESSCENHNDWCFGGKNTDAKGNYVILEAEGKGHYVGCNYNIHNLCTSTLWDWPGEGDDMIFVDGSQWPPTLHGTGTEDYVNMAWCPTQEYSAPYHGLILGGDDNWKGKITYYRYHIRDPITFEQSIRVTIEHGHANHRSDDVSSTAYWYQQEPHKPFEAMLPVEERIPINERTFLWEGKIELKGR